MSVLTQDELSSLFQQYASSLQRLLFWKVKCHEVAADLKQETFLRLLRHERTDDIRDLPAFLYRTALNLAVDHVRKERRRQTAPTDVDELLMTVDDAPTGEDVAVAKQKLTILRQAVAELSPLCQQIFELNRFQGLTHTEVARRLNIAESTVQKNLSRALLHIMQRLKSV